MLDWCIKETGIVTLSSNLVVFVKTITKVYTLRTNNFTTLYIYPREIPG